MTRGMVIRGTAAALLGVAIGAANAAAQPRECTAARAIVPRLLGEMPPPTGPAADAALADAAKRGLTRADGYDALAADVMLHGETATAASASLQSLTLEWGPRHAANLGIALGMTRRPD